MSSDRDAIYRAEGWGTITDEALGIPPSSVESQARSVARWAASRIEDLENENVRLRKDRSRYERQICAAEHGHTIIDVLANYRQIRRDIQDRRAREGGNADGK